MFSLGTEGLTSGKIDDTNFQPFPSIFQHPVAISTSGTTYKGRKNGRRISAEKKHYTTSRGIRSCINLKTGSYPTCKKLLVMSYW